MTEVNVGGVLQCVDRFDSPGIYGSVLTHALGPELIRYVFMLLYLTPMNAGITNLRPQCSGVFCRVPEYCC